MSNHTPEPWRFRSDLAILDNADNIILFVADDRGTTIEQDFKLGNRVVQCVNACAGMKDPMAEIAQLRDDRERLIQLVKELIYGDPSFVVDEYWAIQLLSEIEGHK